MPLLLYLDSSAFLRRAFGHEGADTVDAQVSQYRERGARIVSSRLLWLEAKRVGVRERLNGNDVVHSIDAQLTTIDRLPMTEEVWEGAAQIEAHIKTLDALHIATCRLVGADLLTFDGTMRTVGESLGLAVVR